MNFDVPNQGKVTLDNTTVALSYDYSFSDLLVADAPNFLGDDLSTPSVDVRSIAFFEGLPSQFVGPSSDLGDRPSALEATGRSSGSMEQGQLQALNPNINSENESNQSKITCSSLLTRLKNYGDTLRRIIMKDKEAEKEYFLRELVKIVESKKDDQAFLAELKKKLLEPEWPVEMDVKKIRTDADNVKKSIEAAKKDGSFNIRSVALALKQEVDKIEEAIKALQKKREGKLKKRKLKRDFNPQAQGVSNSDLNARGLNAHAQVQAQSISSSSTSHEEDLCEYAERFLKKLRGEENMEILNFNCLPVTLDNPSTRSEFNSIDGKLRKCCGEAYKETALLSEEKLQVLAAIKEMREVKSIESVDESMLLNWGVAFNKGKQAGYDMKFAETRLELLGCAFFGSQSRFIERHSLVEKCVKAASAVKRMASPIDGMFPSDG